MLYASQTFSRRNEPRLHQVILAENYSICGRWAAGPGINQLGSFWIVISSTLPTYNTGYLCQGAGVRIGNAPVAAELTLKWEAEHSSQTYGGCVWHMKNARVWHGSAMTSVVDTYRPAVHYRLSNVMNQAHYTRVPGTPSAANGVASCLCNNQVHH